MKWIKYFGLALILLVVVVQSTDSQTSQLASAGDSETMFVYVSSDSQFGGVFYHYYSEGEPDLELTFGPPDTTIFRLETCGANIQNYSAVPQNQTATYGIDKLCNNGTGRGTVHVKLSGTPNTGWYLYASNISIDDNLINMSASPTDWKTIYTNLNAGNCIYVWFKATCLNVTQGIGVYEEYRIV
jgi:hypothetical protein